jgi:hypothetical protein
MPTGRGTGFSLLLIGSIVFIAWGIILEAPAPASTLDFGVIYYGARCMLHGGDPYKESDVIRTYRAEQVNNTSQSAIGNPPLQIAIQVYPPTTFGYVAPFALMRWGPAHLLWKTLTAMAMLLAAWLTWSLCTDFASDVAGFLIGLMLAGSIVLISYSNAAGIAVALCIIAVWCFLRGQMTWLGILCLAVSLSIKPHDAGFVWLYFLLVGEQYRRYALQTLLLTTILSLPSILWISHVAPHWIQELNSNLSRVAIHDGLSDPGSTRLKTGMIIDLQALFSLFKNYPPFYNLASYLVCGTLLIIWAVKTLRSRFSLASVWFGLAAIAPLTMLATYHRPYDAKLLLLTIPACAILYTEGGPIATVAVWLNAASVLFTSSIPWITLELILDGLHISTSTQAGKTLLFAMTRPASLILLVMSLFYLWVYVRRPLDVIRTATTSG